MGFRFQKRIKILPGVTVNLGKRGISTSIGVRGARINLGKRGVRTTLGIPGTGISYSKYERYGKSGTVSRSQVQKPYLTVCPYCGHHLRKYWERCPKCHALLQQGSPAPVAEPAPEIFICPHCGGQIRSREKVNFCPLCGSPLRKEETSLPQEGIPPLPAPKAESSSHIGIWIVVIFFVFCLILGLMV